MMNLHYGLRYADSDRLEIYPSGISNCIYEPENCIRADSSDILLHVNDWNLEKQFPFSDGLSVYQAERVLTTRCGGQPSALLYRGRVIRLYFVVSE